jgi:CubicO group peptidase (beta-lactamase class C family)
VVTMTDQVQGTVAPGFERVHEEFRRNFTERGELGAAVAVYHRGEKVVDLWGGIRDKASRAPWEEDTMAVVFSTTKGLSAMAAAVAHSRGLFDYDEPVATYWPEFAQSGKENVTVRTLLNHQAGLCAIDEPLDLDILADPDKLATGIARQKPAWEPGRKQGYHGVSLGWYESALIRCVDPQHRTIGQYFRDEIAQPLELDFFIGLPEAIPRSRLATIDGYKNWQMLFHLHKMPRGFALGMFNPRSLTARTFANPAILSAINSYNEPRIQCIEIPAVNGIGTARSIAKAYREFATGGRGLGLKPETLQELCEPARPPRDGSYDQVLHVDSSFSLGYLKPFPLARFGRDDNRSFGTAGAGGSFGFADPTSEIGYAYVMNKSGFYLFDDPRELSLRKAVYKSLESIA